MAQKVKVITWLDKRGVRDAVRQAVAGKGGKPSPLVLAAEDVKVTAQRSMLGGRKRIESVKGLSQQTRRGMGVKRSKKKTYTIAVPSRPGTPPNAQTGGLKASIRAALTTGKRSSVAGPTVKFGRIHEFGGHIKVTPKMRRYLGWAFGWHLQRGKAFIHLPARPYMRPALRKEMPKLKRRFHNMPLASTPAGKRLNNRKVK